MRLILVMSTIAGLFMGWSDIQLLLANDVRWIVIFVCPTIAYVFLQALASLAEDLLALAGFDPPKG